eukprot:sb/3468194/
MSARMAICTKIGRKPKLVRIRYEKRGRLNCGHVIGGHQTLNAICAFHCHVRERKVRLEDLTEKMDKFDKLIKVQHHWLEQCSEKIAKVPSDTVGSKENNTIINELQTLHTQVLTTNKIGLLIINQHGECVLPTIAKILDLQMHFDNVCSEAHAKHCVINKSQLQLKIFRDSVEGMMSWLHRTTKLVEQKQNQIGHNAKLDELIEWHKKTKRDIDTHRDVKDSIVKFMNLKEDTPEIVELKTSVAELKDGFGNLETSFKKISGSLGVSE